MEYHDVIRIGQYTIRYVSRRGWTREAGYTGWDEYQVRFGGQKIIGRFDMREQAEKFIAERMKTEPAVENRPGTEEDKNAAVNLCRHR